MSKPIIPDLAAEKEIFDQNKNQIIDTFNTALKELENIEIEKTNFAAQSIFAILKEQGQFIEHITKNKHKFANLKSEKALLVKMEGKVKEKFGVEKCEEWIRFLIERMKE